jgi:LL-diaminopimelate aminotransferase
MVKLNQNYWRLLAGYLFPEINKRVGLFLEVNPGVTVMKLGIGNTTEALAPIVVTKLHVGVSSLENVSTYSGYGDEQGNKELREAIASHYKRLGVVLDSSEVFVSDGAKPDSANIQSIFGLNNTIAVQDPAYPVYVDTNVIAGRTGEFEKGGYNGIYYMPCTIRNGFFPEVPKGKVDIIYLCSPNNPTGSVGTRKQLKRMVDYAIAYKAIIIFDAAYSAFITDPDLPKSIYEIDGAKKCAIEINSFSKSAGFTGVRLGWTIVPKSLVTEDSEEGMVNALWNRRQCTFFNGASNIVQAGGLAALSDRGLAENKKIIDFYLENAKIIKEGLESLHVRCFGGVNAPYIWMKTPNNMRSWDFFDKLLNEAHVVGTPGSGFGPSGEGFFRLSAFGHREDVQRAIESIKNNLKI